jgi:hypothetical protein
MIDPLPWLLEDPAIRHLALRDLAGAPPDDPEFLAARAAAHRTGPIPGVLAHLDPEGWWGKPGPGYSPKYFSTVWSLILLAQLGASVEEDGRIGRACGYLLDHALTPAGQFSYNGAPGGTIDCLQGNLCWALTTLGCDDPRLDAAYDWLGRSVTGEGIAAKGDKSTPLRYYAYKCGPNFACGANSGEPCAWGAAKLMLALSVLPTARRTPLTGAAVEQGVAFLLGVDPATAAYPSPQTGKPSESWWKFGFPVFYVTDILQVVEALAGLGYGRDPRLAAALDLVRGAADADGRWPLRYHYRGKCWFDTGPGGKPNRWVTLRASRALRGAQ